MTKYIVEYFRGEKQESFLFIAAGLVSWAIAYFGIFVSDNPILFGAAVPFGLIGLIELVVGGTIATRTNKQIRSLLELRKEDPNKFKETEMERMDAVMKNFKNYRLIEQVLFIAGLIFVVLGMTDQISRQMAGVGMGLMAQSAIMLFLDLFAELRGKEYVRNLKKE